MSNKLDKYYLVTKQYADLYWPRCDIRIPQFLDTKLFDHYPTEKEIYDFLMESPITTDLLAVVNECYSLHEIVD